MDREQLKAIICENLFPNTERWTPDLREHVAGRIADKILDEAVWGAQISAGYDPDRHCPECEGPIEIDRPVAGRCVKCIQRNVIFVLRTALDNIRSRIRHFRADRRLPLYTDNAFIEELHELAEDGLEYRSRNAHRVEPDEALRDQFTFGYDPAFLLNRRNARWAYQVISEPYMVENSMKVDCGFSLIPFHALTAAIPSQATFKRTRSRLYAHVRTELNVRDLQWWDETDMGISVFEIEDLVLSKFTEMIEMHADVGRRLLEEMLAREPSPSP